MVSVMRCVDWTDYLFFNVAIKNKKERRKIKRFINGVQLCDQTDTHRNQKKGGTY